MPSSRSDSPRHNVKTVTSFTTGLRGLDSGRMLGELRKFHGERLVPKSPAAIVPSVQLPHVVYVGGSGKSAKLATFQPIEKPKQKSHRGRFTLQKVKRSSAIVATISKHDKKDGFGKTCATRLVRKVLKVGRPEYLGNGVWSS